MSDHGQASYAELLSQLEAVKGELLASEADKAKLQRKVSREVAKRKKAERATEKEKAEKLKAIDAQGRDFMTGLLNRRGSLEKLALLSHVLLRQNLDTARRPELGQESLVVMAFDIDHFKSVNDTYGHDVGDDAIRKVAAQIEERFKRATDIYARFGGEEFVAVFPRDSQSSRLMGEHVAEGLRDAVENNCFVGPDGARAIHISIGIAFLTPGKAHKNDMQAALEKALKDADDALYAAKHNGRNCVWVKTEAGEIVPSSLQAAAPAPRAPENPSPKPV